uniref:Head decoration protein n=1 Tax=Arsenophonus endosymbiont of Trialeurodes vaporariorum TaxID=235567 RepID=A0A3B0M187_9GAMM
MDEITQNPFAQGVKHALFVPDQLVSGPLQLVTDTVTIAQSGKLKRWTVLGVVTATQVYQVCKKSATDGSQTPSAILADDVDTTEKTLTVGVYLMGEFNQHRLLIDESWSLTELKTALHPFVIFLRDSVQA